MKHAGFLSLLSLFFLCILLSVPQESAAQNSRSSAKITLSKKKIRLDGRTYYLHTVKRGETLFSLAKAYGVQQRDIVAANPNAFTGIRVGEELKIPVPGEDRSYEGLTLEAEQYIFHIAKAGQRKEEIAAQYGMALDSLYRFNPELEYSPIEQGQVIIIPKQGISTLPASAGQDLTLPMSFRQTDTVIVRKDTMDFISEDMEDVLNQAGRIPSGTCNIALLLPLFLDQNAFLDTDNGPAAPFDLFADTIPRPEPRAGIYPRSLNFLEFYQGALVALADLRQKGFRFQIHVYDTGRNVEWLRQLLLQPDMQQMDLLIGPFYSEMLQAVNQFAREHQICFVSPLTENSSLLQQNPYMLQFFPDPQTEYAVLQDYLIRQDAKITFVRNRNESFPSAGLRFMEEVQRAVPAGRFESLSMSADQRDVFDSLQETPDSLRCIFVTVSTDEAFASSLMSQLNVLSQFQETELVGPFSWTRFVNIDLDYFHRLNYHFSAPFFVDRENPNTAQFLRQYGRFFGTEPYEILSKGYNYAFLGYDVTYYFGFLLANYGKDFPSFMEGKTSRLLQSDVRFSRTGAGNGLLNQAHRLMEYTPSFIIQQVP